MLAQYLPQWVNDLLAKYGLTNIAGSVTVILTGVIYVADKYLGCNIGEVIANSTVNLSTTCELPTWFPATWVPLTLGIAASTAFIGKLLRPGGLRRSFFGGTAVVAPKDSPVSGPGTVTPSQVDAK